MRIWGASRWGGSQPQLMLVGGWRLTQRMPTFTRLALYTLSAALTQTPESLRRYDHLFLRGRRNPGLFRSEPGLHFGGVRWVWQR
jgi:hypothetical protein